MFALFRTAASAGCLWFTQYLMPFLTSWWPRIWTLGSSAVLTSCLAPPSTHLTPTVESWVPWNERERHSCTVTHWHCCWWPPVSFWISQMICAVFDCECLLVLCGAEFTWSWSESYMVGWNVWLQSQLHYQLLLFTILFVVRCCADGLLNFCETGLWADVCCVAC